MGNESTTPYLNTQMAPGKADARYLVVTGPATRGFPEVYFSAPPRGGSLTSLSV